jgi:hypothetical protein
MLTLPIEATPESRPESRVLIIGRSENVLSETVRILRGQGQAAGASNDFADVMNLFDMNAVDIVVFGGMVPPDTKELLRQQISARNPAMIFIQGLAGIAGLIVAQVQASRTGDASAPTGLAVTYDPQARTVDLHLDRPEDVPGAPRGEASGRPACGAAAGRGPLAGVLRHRGRRGRRAGARRRPHAGGDDHGLS